MLCLVRANLKVFVNTPTGTRLVRNAETLRLSEVSGSGHFSSGLPGLALMGWAWVKHLMAFERFLA